MNWQKLSNHSANELIALSQEVPVLVFKHSPRCNVSTTALARFERSFDLADDNYYLLNVITERQLSSELAAETGVRHESPQLLILHKGRVLYQASHMSISGSDATRAITEAIATTA